MFKVNPLPCTKECHYPFCTSECEKYAAWQKRNKELEEASRHGNALASDFTLNSVAKFEKANNRFGHRKIHGHRQY